MLRDTASRHGIVIRSALRPRTADDHSPDRVQLQQVLMNLMLNGIEAMQEGQAVT